MSHTSRSERKAKRKLKSNAPVDPEPIFDAAESAPVAVYDAPEITIRDISKIDAAKWPHRDWPAKLGQRTAAFQVIINRSTLNAIHRHGQSYPEVEICGVLVGNVFRDANGPFLVIDASISGDFAGNSSAQVTFTAETWSHIQGVMDREHPDSRIVGWYHTHPGFGIFLSEMDLFIHGNFFNLPWQTAFVYDPNSGEEGMFLWKGGKTEAEPFFVDEDVEKELITIPTSVELTAAALADFSRRVQGMEKRQKTLLIALGFMLLVALAWPFVLFTALSDRRPSSRIPPAVRPDRDTLTLTPTTPSTMPPANPSATPPETPATPPISIAEHTAVQIPIPPRVEISPGAVPLSAATQASSPPASPITGLFQVEPRKDQKEDVKPEVIRPGTTVNGGPRVIEHSPQEKP